MKSMRIILIILTASAGISAAAQPGTSTAVKAGQTVTVEQAPDNKKVDPKAVSTVTNVKAETPQKYDPVAIYQQRLKEQHQSGNHRGEATTAFNLARVSETTASGDTRKLAIAEDGYKQSIQAATEASDVAQKNLATNNLAILLLRQGNRAGALSLLKTIDMASVPPEQRALYTFNLGRSMELTGDSNGAFEKYNAAYVASPDFTEAATSAFRVLQTSESTRIKEAIGISDVLINHGHSDIASQHLPSLLLKWGGNADSQWLLAELLRCYTAQRVTPEKFKDDTKTMDEAAAQSPGLARAVADLKEAFLGKLSPIVAPYPASLTSWTGASWKSDAMAPMLKMIGDWYVGQKQYTGALGRYATAWSLARDPEYALAFASLVRREPELAPQRDYLVTKLVDSLFEYKGEQYRKSDWPNILRMHIAIGTIFEDEKRWGSRSESHSAIFQWAHAIDADQQIRKTNPKAPPAPGLHYHLANCLAATNKNDEAAQEYLAAAELYVKAQDVDAANEAAKRVTSFGKPTGSYAERLVKVEAAVKQLQGPT